MSSRRVLSVGQCDFDHGAISARLRALCGATVVPVDTAAEALHKLSSEQFDLVLVNRIFDVDGGSGLELIQGMKAPGSPPCMLVSNFPEAQAQAQAFGALPGFGKAALADPALADRFAMILGR